VKRNYEKFVSTLPDLCTQYNFYRYNSLYTIVSISQKDMEYDLFPSKKRLIYSIIRHGMRGP